MTKVCANTAALANQRCSETGIASPRNGDANSAVLSVLRALLGPKPWTALADWFGLSNGAARKKMYGERALSADEIAALLRSEHGRDVLAALMGDAQPKWWRAVKSQTLVIESKQASYRAKRMLREAIDVVDETEHAIDRVETALALSHETRDRRGVAARQPLARVPHRTVAQASIGRKSR